MIAKLLLVIAAVGLLAAGVWLGRSSSASPPAVPAASAPSAVRTPAVPPARVRPPVLAIDPDLHDADPHVRRAAIREVARDRASDVTILLAASRDPDQNVGIMATEALGKRYAAGDVDVHELVTRATDHALDERVRVSAINGLGLVPSPEAGATLTDMLGRGDLVERRSAAILLAHQAPDIAVPALIRALADADEVVRTNAIEALRSLARGRDFGADAAAWQAWWRSRT